MFRFTVPLLAVLAACQSTHPLGDNAGPGINDFRIFNRGSYPINEIYFRPTGEKNWSRNIIYSPVLPAEQYLANAPNDITTCRWDIRFVDAVGNTEVDRDVDLCSRTSIVFDGGD